MSDSGDDDPQSPPRRQLLLTQPVQPIHLADGLGNHQQLNNLPQTVHRVVFMPPPQQSVIPPVPVNINPANRALGEPGILRFQPQMQALVPDYVSLPRGCQSWNCVIGVWNPNDCIDFTTVQVRGFIGLVAADRFATPQRVSRRADGRYAKDEFHHVFIPLSHGHQNIAFRMPLSTLDANNEGIGRRAYDYHLATLVCANRFYAYDAKVLCLFLVHLTPQARALLKSIFVEFITDDDENGENWTSQATRLLQTCTGINEFYFGYCGSCFEARCSEEKWRNLMELRGMQRVFCMRRPADRNCRECRLTGNAPYRPWNSTAPYQSNRPTHRLAVSRYNNRIRDFIDALYRVL